MTSYAVLRPLVADRSWTVEAACRPGAGVPVDLWAADNDTARAVAVHVCRSHCPVRAECDAEAQLRAGTPAGYRSMVVGGVAYDRRGRASQRRTGPCRCPLCAVSPWDWPPPDAHPAVDREEVAPCGTDAGYGRHRRRKEQICQDCRVAHNASDQARKRLRRKAAKAATA